MEPHQSKRQVLEILYYLNFEQWVIFLFSDRIFLHNLLAFDLDLDEGNQACQYREKKNSVSG